MRKGKSRANRKRVADINILALLWRRRGKNPLGEAGQPISYFIWPSVEGGTAPIQLRQDEWRWRFAFLGKPIMTYPLLSPEECQRFSVLDGRRLYKVTIPPVAIVPTVTSAGGPIL